MEMTIGCPEVGQTDNLAHLGIKGTPTEILLLPTFSNAIFSKSFNFGFCVWGLGGVSPISGYGELFALFWGGVSC